MTEFERGWNAAMKYAAFQQELQDRLQEWAASQKCSENGVVLQTYIDRVAAAHQTVDDELKKFKESACQQ